MRKFFSAHIPRGASIRERKTAALGNRLLLSMIAFTLFLLIVDELLVLFGLANRLVSILEAGFLLLYVVSWVFHRRGRFRIGKMMFLVVGNFHAGMIALYFGPNTAAVWYFLVFFVLPLLLFSSGDWKIILGLMVLSVGMAVSVEVYFANYGAPIAREPEVEKLLYYLNSVFVFVILGLCVYYFFRATLDAESLLEEEQHRSERLLLNVLPPRIAARLKDDKRVIADQFENVSVLFSDIVGFTRFSQTVQASELVHVLNELFSRFDDLSLRHGLEKIKTIGDAYMVVGGVPELAPDHAERTAAMAFDMLAAMKDWSARHGLNLDLRIGIHSGSVVAGVIGKQKFIYDLWGDTVNTASRMESHGEPGRIHVSVATADLLEARYGLTPRGSIEVKGKGAMNTFFLAGARGDG